MYKLITLLILRCD